MADDATGDDAAEPTPDAAAHDRSDDVDEVDDEDDGEAGEEADELTAGEGGADEAAPATASPVYRFWRRVRALSRGQYLRLALLSIAALVVAAVLGLPLLAVAAVALGVFADWTAAYPVARGATRLNRWGTGPRTRTMLRGLGVTIVLAVASEGDPVVLLAYAASVVFLQLCWTSFQRSMSRAIATRPAMAVRNIGQELELRTFYARARRRAAHGPSVLHVADIAVVAGMAVAIATPQPGIVAVVAAVLGMAAMFAFAAFARRWSDRFRASGRVERYERQLRAQLEAFDPQVIVHISAGTSQTYMFNQWMDAFNAVPRRLLFVVREATHLSRLSATHWPMVYATRTRDVERFVLPNVRIVFYAANGVKNVHLLREAGVKHVFLNHGDSDKSSSANPVTRVYNELWVAGPAAIDRYEAAGIDIPRSSFAIVGRPQVDGMTPGPRPRPQPPRILYAPTWEGAYEESNYSSLEVMGVEIVRRIIAERPDWGIVFKPHPATGKHRSGMLAAKRQVDAMLREAPNAEHHLLAGPARLSVYDCFAEADVLISDISSVVTDFLVTDRPVLVSNPKDLPVDEYLRLFPSQRASYLVDAACEALLPMLDLAVADDPLAAERRAMRAYLHGEHPNGPLQTFRDNVERLYDRATEDARSHRSYFKFADHTVTSA